MTSTNTAAASVSTVATTEQMRASGDTDITAMAESSDSNQNSSTATNLTLLAELYKQHPCLYVRNPPDNIPYSERISHRREALNIITGQMRAAGDTDITVDTVKAQIKNYRDVYVRQKKAGFEKADMHPMAFLEPYITSRSRKTDSRSGDDGSMRSDVNYDHMYVETATHSPERSRKRKIIPTRSTPAVYYSNSFGSEISETVSLIKDPYERQRLKMKIFAVCSEFMEKQQQQSKDKRSVNDGKDKHSVDKGSAE